MAWFPLNVRSTYSLLHGIMSASQIADRCVELGLSGCALVDNSTLACAVDFVKEMEKKKLKWIIGCEFNVVDNEKITPIIIYAKNLNGWKELVRLVSLANHPDNFQKIPLLKPEHINITQNIIIINPTIDRPGIFQEICYAKRGDAVDQRVVLCSYMNTTLRKYTTVINKYPEVSKFFESNEFFMWSIDEILQKYSQEDIDVNNKLAEQCETYNIFSNPMLPKFTCPNEISELEYLTQLTRNGWKNKIATKVPKSKHEEYGVRVREELAIMKEANLAGYLLIVEDIITEFKKRGYLLGSGRGSIGGSLVAYLIGLTCIDSIEYDLLFSRFYNKGRNTPGHIALPDIDTDFPKCAREQVIEYLKNKYGHDCVAHISTYGGMKGRGAIKDVLRAHEACDFAEMNRITEHIPDEAKIADQLQELEEEGENATILDWALTNKADQLKEWCWKDENGQLQGRFAKLFEQAIRLEGTKRNRGRHAAGVIISPTPLHTVCPMIYDKDSKELICGMEFEKLEALGLVKIDILGIALLDKLMGVNKLLQGADLNEI